MVLRRLGKCYEHESATGRQCSTHERGMLTPQGSPDARKLQPDPGDGPVVAAQSGQAPAQRERCQLLRPRPWKNPLAPDGGTDARMMPPDRGDGPVVAEQSG